jgi:hypothetical protein
VVVRVKSEVREPDRSAAETLDANEGGVRLSGLAESSMRRFDHSIVRWLLSPGSKIGWSDDNYTARSRVAYCLWDSGGGAVHR